MPTLLSVILTLINISNVRFSSIKKSLFLFGEYGHVFVFYKNLVFHFSNIQIGFFKQYVLFPFYLCVFSTGPFIKIVNKASINKIIIYTILKQLTIVCYWRSFEQSETVCWTCKKIGCNGQSVCVWIVHNKLRTNWYENDMNLFIMVY